MVTSALQCLLPVLRLVQYCTLRHPADGESGEADLAVRFDIIFPFNMDLTKPGSVSLGYFLDIFSFFEQKFGNLRPPGCR